MATEIERKFLVRNDQWRAQATDKKTIQQGYFETAGRASLRVRISGDKANINIKSATLDVVRKEYEIVIPLQDAKEMLEHLCLHPIIQKTRYYVPYGAHVWEIDVFDGDNEGLVVAEIELAAADEVFEKPAWLGDEVSHDTRYYNVCLVNNPYKNWRAE